MGTTPMRGCGPLQSCQLSAATCHHGGVPDTGGCCLFLRVTAPSTGSPEARVRFRRGDGLPGGRNRAAGGVWGHGASPGRAGSLPEEHAAAAAAFLTAGGRAGLNPWLLYLLREFNSDCPCRELECPWSRRDQFCQIPPPRDAKLQVSSTGCHSAPSLSGQDTFPLLSNLRNGRFL